MSKNLRMRLAMHAKIIVPNVLIFAALAAFEYGYFPSHYEQRLLADLHGEAETVSAVVAYTLAPAVDFEEPELAREALLSASRMDELVAVGVYLDDGRLFSAYPSSHKLPRTLSDFSSRTLSSVLVKQTEIRHSAEGRRGTLLLLADETGVFEEAQRFRSIATMIAAALVAMGLLVGVGISMFTFRMSESRAREEAAHKSNRAKSEFLAHMSHEIRTPLTGVVGMAELLGKSELSARQRHFVRTIRRSGQSLLATINDILDFSKIEANQVVLEDVPVDLVSLVDDAVDTVAPTLKPGVRLLSVLGEDVPRWVLGDPLRLRQILVNLVGNAAKFTDRGHILLSIRAQVANGGSVLEFAVGDTGIGISESAQRTLFEAFTQADRSTTRRYGGTGLGLAISASLVRAMGGSLEVTSVPAEGSRFFFRVAHRRVDNEEVAIFQPHEGIRVVLHGTGVEADLIAEQFDAWNVSYVRMEEEGATVSACDGGQQGDQHLCLNPALKGLEYIPPEHLVVVCDSESVLPEVDGRAQIVYRPIGPGRLLELLPHAEQPIGGHAIQGAQGNPTQPPSRMRAGPSRAPLPEENAADLPNLHRVLVVDDGSVNREVVGAMLDYLQVPYALAENGAEALLQLDSKHRFTAVLMDCEMPDMDGYEVTQRVRAAECAENRRQVPIVALTADATDVAKAKARDAGMDEFLNKPIPLEELRNLLSRLSSTAQSSEEVQLPQEAQSSQGVQATSEAQVSSEALDPEILRELLELQRATRPTFFADMASTYVDESAKRIEAISEVFDSATVGERELATLGTEAHALKGASMHIGALPLADLAAQLESHAGTGDELFARTIAEQIGEEYRRVRQALYEHCGAERSEDEA